MGFFSRLFKGSGSETILTFRLSKEIRSRIMRVMSISGTKTITDHFRWALAVFDTLLEYRSEGWVVVVERGDESREVKLPPEVSTNESGVDGHKIIYFKNYRDKEEEDT